jgi:signal transduction histidine kinase/ligand-binding sensor domain-containing protein/DNA-binding response OmpR family regulator
MLNICKILFYGFLYILIIFFTNLFAQKNNIINWPQPKFKHFTVKDGLPENSVFAIEQDYLGYLWFGTQNGLVKYDGYLMKVYQSDLSKSQSDEGRFITCIYEDKLNTLWIGTLEGLTQYDRVKDTYVNYNCNPSDNKSISSNNVNCVYEDNSGNLWVGTDNGLNLFDRNVKNFKHYKFYDSNSSKYPNNNLSKIKINSIIEYPSKGKLLLCMDHVGLYSLDIATKQFREFKLCFNEKQIDNFYSFFLGKDSTLWIGCSTGLIKYHPKNIICKLYNNLYYGDSIRRENSIKIVESNDGMLYISFANGGLVFFDPKDETFQRFLSEDNNPQGFHGNYVNALYVDRSGILWIGTWSNGLSKYDGRKIKFHSLMNEPTNPNSLNSNWVLSIFPDISEGIWIITDRMVEKWNAKSGKIDHMLQYENFSSTNYFIDGLIDNMGSLWIGTIKQGIVKFDPATGSHSFYFSNQKLPVNLYNIPVLPILKDHLGYFWIGTIGKGLYRFNPETGAGDVFRYNADDTQTINNDEILTIYEDSYNTIWIGTQDGLNKYDRNRNSFTHTKLSATPTIYEDKGGNFWIGTYTNGLYLFDRNKGKIIANFTEKDGLTNNAVRSIIEDDSGNLWLGTYNGLSKFNVKNKSFKNYYTEDGLNDNFMQMNTTSKSSDGILYFGMVGKGINYFHPDSIKDDPIPPQVVIENISLFNRPDEKLNYEGFISEFEMIELPYNQNDLLFEYVGLHFSEPAKNKYKYILEGFDENWIDAGNQRAATYTNLDHGEYIFKVNAANRDGIWNEKGASIKIIILPPWWKTMWAYISYILFIAGILYFTWRLQLKRIRTKHEFEMSKFEAEKLHEVDELKSRFFANISHEFRTPLTLILGPAKDIIDSTKEIKTKQTAGLIKRNAGRLLGLVNQLLDLSKLEAGKMKLETREQDIVPLLKGLVLSFSSLADLKKIKLDFNTTQDGIDIYLDKDKIEKIINNILTNAFKFTPEGGKIEVSVEKKVNEVEIKISDNGIGIPEENMDKIFDRFYQVDGSHTREQEGTGIGLALTKELVELHKGKIEVESETGKGTTFIVRIPLGKEHLKPEEITEEKTEKKNQIPIDEPELIVETNNRKEKTDIDVFLETDKPLLLVVEDNSDVRKYIISHLEDNYRIQEAVDGEDGLKQAFNHIPDLIISDIMMPKMDGFELCNKLKTDERTSHIPIIMLTAKATSHDKISGYEIGADDYVMKPFDATELKVRVKNLIELRRKLQEKFRSADFALPTELSSIDEQFMKRVLKTINEHISEEEFSIDELGKEVAMSRQHLHRKLKAISGKSPSLFIRSVKLAKAKKLIMERKGTISEISFLVGFGSPAYFNKCFKEEFGYSPGELT